MEFLLASGLLPVGSYVKLFTDDGVNLQSVKAYLRRGTAREFVGNYKGANEGQKHFPPALVFPCIC